MALMTCMTTAKPSGRPSCCGAVLAGVAAVLASTALPAASATPVACAPSQQTVFACRTGSRQVAVCASPDLAASGGALSYRYGPAQRADLVLPAGGADWRSLTRSGLLMYSGGGGAYLAFANGRHRYVVYTAMLKGEGEVAGLVVERDGRRIASQRCRGTVRSELGPALFERAAIRPAEGDFELP